MEDLALLDDRSPTTSPAATICALATPPRCR